MVGTEKKGFNMQDMVQKGIGRQRLLITRVCLYWGLGLTSAI